MKQITKNTIFKQGDKIYQLVEVDGVIYWVDKKSEIEKYWYNSSTNQIDDTKGLSTIQKNINNKNFWNHCWKIIAQSQPKLEEIPVISFDSYVEKLFKPEPDDYEGYKNGWINGYKSNPNNYTQKDIERAIELARQGLVGHGDLTVSCKLDDLLDNVDIIDQINQISSIEVDQEFNIISYD
jgi:hypothetical protein